MSLCRLRHVPDLSLTKLVYDDFIPSGVVEDGQPHVIMHCIDQKATHAETLGTFFGAIRQSPDMLLHARALYHVDGRSAVFDFFFLPPNRLFAVDAEEPSWVATAEHDPAADRLTFG